MSVAEMMAAPIFNNNYGPSTIQLEGQAAVSAAKEKEAKNALRKSEIQHGRELQVT